MLVREMDPVLCDASGIGGSEHGRLGTRHIFQKNDLPLLQRACSA